MSFCLWLTGLPGSGKSTILKELIGLLAPSWIKPVVLSLDHIRKVVTPKPRYTDEERYIVYRFLALTAHLLVSEGNRNVIIDATANRREFRDLGRELIADFAEIYVECPVKTCEEREALRRGQPVERDLYQRARKGTLTGQMPGVSTPYEPPEHPEVVVASDSLSPREAAEKIADYVRLRWPDQAAQGGGTC